MAVACGLVLVCSGGDRMLGDEVDGFQQDQESWKSHMKEMPRLMDTPEFQKEMERCMSNPEEMKKLASPEIIGKALDMLKDPKYQKDFQELLRDNRFQSKVNEMLMNPEMRKTVMSAENGFLGDPKVAHLVKKLEENLKQVVQADPSLAIMCQDIATNGGKSLSRVTRDPENWRKLWGTVNEAIPWWKKKAPPAGQAPTAEELEELSVLLQKTKIMDHPDCKCDDNKCEAKNECEKKTEEEKREKKLEMLRGAQHLDDT
eukprot:CAMPEP_0197517214 /NCGR_PEP_ID=MMETSP1318-20131121/2196_1 /TAXON_ID=552666 /ORGANISM="Partenskyella glossopodia, Strain RCC365" /LENGTH=258 /DNA_ID=CAMNT_0043066597 /DNA_START=18 /DNA_END=794 /DNA_ORIENTATION=+